jgi:hypothetical protein
MSFVTFPPGELFPSEVRAFCKSVTRDQTCKTFFIVNYDPGPVALNKYRGNLLLF